MRVKHKKLIFAVTLSCLLTVGISGEQHISATVPGVNQLISVDSSENQGNAGSSDNISVSADGRFVAFTSGASNLVTGDTNGTDDVFVRDTVNGTTTRVSVSSSGTQSTGTSGQAQISHDGRYVVFWNTANDLDPAFGNNNNSDVYRRDLITSNTILVSKTPSGYGCNGTSCNQPDISADGRFVTFVGESNTLIGGTGSNGGQIFVRDMITNTNKIVSLDSSGNPSVYGGSTPRISCDGGTITFTSYASDVRSGAGSSYRNVHYIVRAANEYAVAATVSSNGNSNLPAISCDGTHISFHSAASNLTSGDTNAKEDIFVYNIVDKTIKLVSRSTLGALGNNNCDTRSSLSGNGNLVVYASSATNLVANDTNGQYDLFVTNITTGTTERLSVDSSLTQGNGQSYAPDISYNGKLTAFSTSATNLVANDTNGFSDIILSETGY
jgi:hypothetical protein